MCVCVCIQIQQDSKWLSANKKAKLKLWMFLVQFAALL